MVTPEINENYHYVQNGLYKCRIKPKNSTLISCAVLELLRKVSKGGGIPPPPPGEIGLTNYSYVLADNVPEVTC